jgi:hypothetical protein
MSFVSTTAPPLSLPSLSDDSQSYPSVPNNTLDIDDVSCAKSEWDMLSVAVAMYELYWFESRQKDADSSSKRRRTKVKMPPPRRENTIVQIANAAGGLGHAIWDFLTLIITLLPKLGALVANILAVVVVMFVALYIFISRGFGDYLVCATQMAVIGLIFPNSSYAVVKEF